MKAQSTISAKEVEQQIEKYSKQINYYVVEYTLDYLASQYDDRFYIPPYQREFVWEEIRRCRFIESIIMGLPIPFLFFSENSETGKLEIIDGSQRIRTIHQFITNNLTLSGLKRLDKLNGLKFSDLEKSRQRKITNKSIRGIILSSEADMNARLDLFNRINTSSKHATPAEIRKGTFNGRFSKMLNELSEETLFRDLLSISAKQEREQEYLELVTRFFAYGDGLENYSDSVQDFLFDYVQRMDTEANASIIKAYKQRFIQMLKFVKKYFPSGFYNPRHDGKNYTRTRFESIAVGVWWAIHDKGEKNLITKDMEWTKSDEYKEILRSDAANNSKTLHGRIEYVYKRLIGE